MIKRGYVILEGRTPDELAGSVRDMLDLWSPQGGVAVEVHHVEADSDDKLFEREEIIYLQAMVRGV